MSYVIVEGGNRLEGEVLLKVLKTELCPYWQRVYYVKVR